MKLTELDAKFYRREMQERTRTLRRDDGMTEEVTGPCEVYIPVETLAEADGVQFLCPLCFKQNGGPVGTHWVHCWFVGKVPDGTEPGPGRWNPSGTGLHDLTFVPLGAVSVQLLSGCRWHGHVRNGEAD